MGALLWGLWANNAPAAEPSVVGSFVEGLTPGDSRLFADDVADRLARLYAPAGTRFELQQSATDGFGQALIRQLRGKGFAVQEYEASAKPSAPEANVSSVRITYVVDSFGDGLRIAIRFDGWKALDRVYRRNAGQWQAASAWTLRQ